MEARTPTPPLDEAVSSDPDGPTPEPSAGGEAALPDLSTLPIAGITRRRLGFLVGALVGAWIVIVFARQVGEASAATGRVEALTSANGALSDQLAALEREADLIQRQEWVVQQARGHRLGEPGEIPFVVTDTTPLPPDAPGSAAVRLGATDEPPTPLESWLSLLFGPSR